MLWRMHENEMFWNDTQNKRAENKNENDSDGEMMKFDDSIHVSNKYQINRARNKNQISRIYSALSIERVDEKKKLDSKWDDDDDDEEREQPEQQLWIDFGCRKLGHYFLSAQSKYNKFSFPKIYLL